MLFIESTAATLQRLIQSYNPVSTVFSSLLSNSEFSLLVTKTLRARVVSHIWENEANYKHIAEVEGIQNFQDYEEMVKS
jgi:hypothetical protein